MDPNYSGKPSRLRGEEQRLLALGVEELDLGRVGDQVYGVSHLWTRAGIDGQRNSPVSVSGSNRPWNAKENE